MAANPNTFDYIRQGVDSLLSRGSFRGGQDFRPTQHDALQAYYNFLYRNDLTPEQKLKGFFEIPTGVGKTAMFLAILNEAHRIARANNDKLRAMIVVPTIPILEQMEGEVEKWVPDYWNKIGFYGGKSREIGQELTVITYDSWVNLIEAKEIDSSNVDVLISDEAHRGTSERRITNIFNAFSAGTMQLAFTATAWFDEDKSVLETHQNQIFKRGIGESIILGELASYIQTQLHIIRLEPDDWPPQFDDPAQARAFYMGKRQEAWIRNILEIFKHGRDDHTWDYLSDNKSAFYVRSVAMAERLAEVANADPLLQAKARERGCESVIMPIHSYLPRDERVRRLDAFRWGQYMAAASDQQLKEGYNDPSLKTVFDYPRSSLVDKTQILGRASRKWFNPVKKRDEGATVVDTIIYTGHDDPEQDRVLKDDALRRAILAWDVLDGTAVFNKYLFGRAKGLTGYVKPVLGVDVDSYSDLEDVKSIYAHRSLLKKEHEIELTDDMKTEFKAQIRRTGLKPERMCEIINNMPDGLNASVIRLWEFKRTVSVDAQHWHYIMDKYKSLPDGNDAQIIEVTKDMHAHLIAERERTGAKSRKISKLAGMPKMFHAKIENWVNRRSKIADKAVWERIMSVYKHLPDVAAEQKDENKILMTDEMHTELLHHRKRTGLGSKAFLNSVIDVPDYLKAQSIQRWVLRKQKNTYVSKNDWVVVIENYRGLPDAASVRSPAKGWIINKNDPESILITDEMHADLMQQIDRTGKGSHSVLKNWADVPVTLNAQRISGWVRHRGETYVHKDEWGWLMKLYESLPDKPDAKPKGCALAP